MVGSPYVFLVGRVVTRFLRVEICGFVGEGRELGKASGELVGIAGDSVGRDNFASTELRDESNFVEQRRELRGENLVK